MSDHDREALTRGEDFASFERRMMKLFERMAERAETSERESQHREERIQRAVEFLIQQQAQFQAKSEAGMQRLQELHEKNERKWEHTEDSVRSLHAIAQIHEGEIMALAESHSDTKGRLNALIDTVERVVSERRNGGGKKEESSE